VLATRGATPQVYSAVQSLLHTFRNRPGWLFLLVALLFLAGVYVAVYSYFYYVAAALCAVPFVYLGLKNLKWLWLFGVAGMPVSLNLEDLIGKVAIVLPSDVIGIGVTFALIIKWPHFRPAAIRLLRHPISLVLLAWVGWMLLCIFSSQLPVVSIKYFLSTVWMLGGFYLFSGLVMQDRRETVNWVTWPLLAFAIALGLTLVKHAAFGFTLQRSYVIMQPFYKEHTAYAASIAVYAAGALMLLVFQRQGLLRRGLMAGYVALLFAAIMFSFTRGAWLGIVGAFGWFGVLFFWARFKWLIISVGGFAVVFFALQLQFDSDEVASEEHPKTLSQRVKSIMNTKTDASNAERVNRWASALRMIKERPLMGFGPGAFAKTYAPYQRAAEMTYVSTRRGDVGSTHNELLLAASEMGIPGALLMLLLYIVSIRSAALGYLRNRTWERRLPYAVAFCGLLTFYVHGVVNNFLDQDKVAIPVYCCLAAIVAMDTFHRQAPTPEDPDSHV